MTAAASEGINGSTLLGGAGADSFTFTNEVTASYVSMGGSGIGSIVASGGVLGSTIGGSGADTINLASGFTNSRNWWCW